MKKELIKNKHYLLLLAIGLFLTACGVVFQGGSGRTEYDYQPGSEASVLNGERIYFTATNNSGERISSSGGPRFGGGMMSGSFLTCASCHGPEARGGVHVMHMQTMDAPDIRYVTLSSEEGEHGAEEGEEGDGHGEYDLETFRMAVIEGKHPNGDSLGSEMPRWRINDADLADLLAFLKVIP
jgi:hypothetical protein